MKRSQNCAPSLTRRENNGRTQRVSKKNKEKQKDQDWFVASLRNIIAKEEVQVGQQKASSTKSDTVVKEDKGNFGKPWNIVATFETYQQADERRKVMLEESSSTDDQREVKVKRMAGDVFVVKVRVAKPLSNNSKHRKHKKKGKKSG